MQATRTVTYRADGKHPITGQFMPGEDSRPWWIGRKAIFTTWEGQEMVGTIDGFHQGYPRVVFPDGRWARLDRVVTLVEDQADEVDPADEPCHETGGAHDWVDEPTPDWEICGRCGVTAYRRNYR